MFLQDPFNILFLCRKINFERSVIRTTNDNATTVSANKFDASMNLYDLAGGFWRRS